MQVLVDGFGEIFSKICQFLIALGMAGTHTIEDQPGGKRQQWQHAQPYQATEKSLKRDALLTSLHGITLPRDNSGLSPEEVKLGKLFLELLELDYPATGFQDRWITYSWMIARDQFLFILAEKT